MDSALVAILGAAGLAGATGHRAFIPAFLLGAMHHVAPMMDPANPFFQLNETFAWLASPVVMVVLGALIVLEFIAEANPDVPELTEWAMKAPKLIAGFGVVAATVGTTTDSMTMIVGSGVLGSGTALTVDSLRAKVKHALGDASGGGTNKALALAETGWAAGLSVIAVVIPILVLLAVGITFLVYRSRTTLANSRLLPCPACGAGRHADAVACPHCKAAIA